jgi:phosphoglucosamine mutase
MCRESGRTLDSWNEEMQEYPQKLVSIPVRTKEGWQEIGSIREAIQTAEARIAGRGRINVRPSGTEKKIRVMVEGPDVAEVEDLTEFVAGAIRTALGV